MGVHKAALPKSIEDADDIIWFQPKGLDWDIESVVSECNKQGHKSVLFDDIEVIIKHLVDQAKAGDAIVLMSNGGFGGIHQKLADALKELKLNL
jgi:UDP-N-acetylmuramate: L-alanyl-gamma-D-glutamyl-meso-diaminopimelate ligase